MAVIASGHSTQTAIGTAQPHFIVIMERINQPASTQPGVLCPPKSGPDTLLLKLFSVQPFPSPGTLVQWCGQTCFPNLPRPCVILPVEAVFCQPTFCGVLSHCQKYLSFGWVVLRGGVLSCQHRAQRSGNCKRIISSIPNKLDLSDSWIHRT